MAMRVTDVATGASASTTSQTKSFLRSAPFKFRFQPDTSPRLCVMESKTFTVKSVTFINGYTPPKVDVVAGDGTIKFMCNAADQPKPGDEITVCWTPRP